MQQLYKGSLQTIILELLSQQEQMYGYEITQKVKIITNQDLNISEGALYPALHKLEAEGLLETEIVRVNNRMRKYYKLTENGLKEKQFRIEELKKFINNMKNIINPEIKLA